jgi:hypothetical protein
MRIVAGAVACALLLSGCVGSAPKPAAPPPPVVGAGTVGTPFSLTDADRAAIEAGVRAHLNNPATAAFRTMTATITAEGTVTACGYVNTGTGDKPYIGTMVSPGFTVSGYGGTREEIIAVQASCSQHRIHI